MTKKCRGCGKEKEQDAFSKHPMMRSGRLNYCKSCVAEKAKVHPSRSPEARSAEHKRARLRAGLPAVHVLLTAEERRRRTRASSLRWNREARGIPLDAPLRDDQGRPPEYYRARRSALQMKRQAAKLQRTPKWLTAADQELMEFMYAEAAALRVATGIKFQVDHEIPLQGAAVSGLHVPSNLRVISAFANRSKGNRYDPDAELVGF